MTRQHIFLVVAIAVVGAIGVVIWIADDRSLPASSEIPDAAQRFDTTGGQEMRPRWNSQEGADDDTP